MSNRKMVPRQKGGSPLQKQQFLKRDLRDALKWLFVGAVIWEAAKRGKERCPNQHAVGMFTSFIQARALYEFYYKRERDTDDARAYDFCNCWRPPRSNLHPRYLTSGRPLNKRVFHLVYDRERHAGTSGPSGPGHLNQQVLAFARELLRITKKFVLCVRPELTSLAQSALREGLSDAQNAADFLGLANPFS
jgi:hypothetical protein